MVESFDDPSMTWLSLNDPVMGGESSQPAPSGLRTESGPRRSKRSSTPPSSTYRYSSTWSDPVPSRTLPPAQMRKDGQGLRIGRIVRQFNEVWDSSI